MNNRNDAINNEKYFYQIILDLDLNTIISIYTNNDGEQ